ncbi:MAG TPA: YihY/virulence factor BrkB family protein [Candidatus Limnocylindrales bacterium]|jgi:membrane protein|nr:YihY/virulence factor BrkB family protein [Candidatus Limnocylindrales bacterium]
MADQTTAGRLKTLVGIVRRTVTNFITQEGMQWAGAVAFYLVLSVPPMLIAASSLAILVMGADAARELVTDQVTEFIPVERDLIEDVADATIGGIGPAALISIVFLLFSGTRIFAALITAINVMWHEVEQAGFVRMQVVRAIFLVTVGVLFALGAMLDGIVALAGDELPIEGVAQWLVESELIPFTLLFLALLTMLKLVPRRMASWTSAVVGALVGALGLRIAQYGFTAFLATLGDFETAYGPLAGIAALMTWALVASVTVLLSAHLVAVLNQPETPAGDSREQARAGSDEGGEDERAPGKPERAEA